MKPSLRSARIALCALAALATPALVQAQVDALRAPLAETSLTKPNIQARIEAVARISPADTALQNELTARYRDAAAALEALESARSRLTRWQALRSTGAKQLSTLREPQPTAEDGPAADALATDELNSRLKAARATADAAVRTQQGHERALNDLLTREKELPGLVAKADEAFRAAEAAHLASDPAKPDPVRGAASHAATLARLIAARVEREAIQTELDSFALAKDVATARRDRAIRETKAAQALVVAIQDAFTARMKDEAERMVHEARERRDALQTKSPVLQAIASETLSLARQRVDVQREIPPLRAKTAETRNQIAETRKRLLSLRQMVLHAGLTQTTGDLLRQHKARLPDVASYRVQSRKRQESSANIRVQQLHISELLAVDVERFVAQALDNSPSESGLEREARRLHQHRADILAKLQADYDDQLAETARLETEDLLLTRLAQEFEGFIDEKILWVRSDTPIWSADFTRFAEVLAALPAATETTEAAWKALSAGTPQLASVIALLLALLLTRRRLKHFVAAASRTVEPGTSVVFVPTLLVFIASLVLAAPVAVLLWGGAILCRGIDVVALFGSGPADAFLLAAVFAVGAGAVREMCRTDGLCSTHLGWPEVTVARLRRLATLALWSGVPLILATKSTLASPPLARTLFTIPVFVLGWLWALTLLASLVRPGRSILDTEEVASRRRPDIVLFALAFALPITLAGLAAAGYLFTATQLSGQLLWSFCLVFGLVTASGIVNRWQLMSRRRLAFRQRQERLEAARAAATNPTAEGATAPSTPDERLNVAEVSAQARRLTRTLFAVVGIVSLFAIWASVLPALGGLREIEVWNTTETAPGPDAADGSKTTVLKLVPISLADVLLCVIVIGMTVVAARNLPGLLKLSVLQRVRPGNQYAIAALVQYGIVATGIILAFAAIGIGWSKVQWLIAAVSLGLGFGLQEIFANFVSGLILLFERPIRVGDFVTVGTTKGEVTRIRIRATTIRNLERQELIVPNKEFITGQVINWTLSDRMVRMVVNVGIAYGSDVALARETLLRITAENPHAVTDPKPKVIFKEFGESSLNFEVRVFIRDLDLWPKALNSLHEMIDREFRAAGIEIAFPQRDLHVRSADAPLKVDLDPRSAGDEETDHE